MTSETLAVELAAIRRAVASALFGLEVLALDTHVAGAAQRIVQLVIVLGAVRPVVKDVEISRFEFQAAVAAGKALPVVSTRESAVCRGHRLANNCFTTAPAATLGTRRGAR